MKVCTQPLTDVRVLSMRDNDSSAIVVAGTHLVHGPVVAKLDPNPDTYRREGPLLRALSDARLADGAPIVPRLFAASPLSRPCLLRPFDLAPHPKLKRAKRQPYAVYLSERWDGTLRDALEKGTAGAGEIVRALQLAVVLGLLGVVHGDLKLNQFLVRRQGKGKWLRVCVSDFGFSGRGTRDPAAYRLPLSPAVLGWPSLVREYRCAAPWSPIPTASAAQAVHANLFQLELELLDHAIAFQSRDRAFCGLLAAPYHDGGKAHGCAGVSRTTFVAKQKRAQAATRARGQRPFFLDYATLVRGARALMNAESVPRLGGSALDEKTPATGPTAAPILSTGPTAAEIFPPLPALSPPVTTWKPSVRRWVWAATLSNRMDENSAGVVLMRDTADELRRAIFKIDVVRDAAHPLHHQEGALLAELQGALLDGRPVVPVLYSHGEREFTAAELDGLHLNRPEELESASAVRCQFLTREVWTTTLGVLWDERSGLVTTELVRRAYRLAFALGLLGVVHGDLHWNQFLARKTPDGWDLCIADFDLSGRVVTHKEKDKDQDQEQKNESKGERLVAKLGWIANEPACRSTQKAFTPLDHIRTRYDAALYNLLHVDMLARSRPRIALDLATRRLVFVGGVADAPYASEGETHSAIVSVYARPEWTWCARPLNAKPAPPAEWTVRLTTERERPPTATELPVWTIPFSEFAALAAEAGAK
jgi:hypothetical protein